LFSLPGFRRGDLGTAATMSAILSFGLVTERVIQAINDLEVTSLVKKARAALPVEERRLQSSSGIQRIGARGALSLTAIKSLVDEYLVPLDQVLSALIPSLDELESPSIDLLGSFQLAKQRGVIIFISMLISSHIRPFCSENSRHQHNDGGRGQSSVPLVAQDFSERPLRHSC
jgi:hypothetical protein